MNRKKERILIRIMGAWQILDGVITILYFGLYKLRPTLADTGHPYANSLFTLTSTFGILLITLGLINLVISKKYVKDNQVSYKIGFFMILQGLFSYLVMDVISVILGMTAGVITLAKNKVIQLKAS